MDSYDMEIIQGSTYCLSMTLRDSDSLPIDLTNYLVSGQIRYRYSDSAILTSLTTEITSAVNGEINVTIPASGTKNLPIGVGVYDIEMTNTGNGTVTKPLAGRAYFYPETTR